MLDARRKETERAESSTVGYRLAAQGEMPEGVFSEHDVLALVYPQPADCDGGANRCAGLASCHGSPSLDRGRGDQLAAVSYECIELSGWLNPPV